MKIATWNVRTLNRPGAVIELETELNKYKIQIAALQEVRWKESGEIKLKNGSIFWKGRRDKHAEGVGFYVHKSLRDAVLEFEEISSRLARIRLNTNWFKTTVLVAYAPTEIKGAFTR